MAIHKTHFRGKTSIKGRPKEQAAAEIMVNKADFHLQTRKRRQFFFTALDILAVVSLGASIYTFYKGQILNGFLTLIPAIVILIYFLIKNYLGNKSRKFKK